MWRGTRVLVTGGAGLIGSHIVDALLARGARVTVLDNLEPQTHPRGKPAWIPPGVRFVQGDVRSPADLDAAAAGAELVFHQAAFGGFTREVSKYLDVNGTGTARLYEALARAGTCRRVVIASSQAVYGEGPYACAAHGTFHPRGYRDLEDLRRGFFEVRCPACREAASPRPAPEDLEHHGDTPYALSKHVEERAALALGRGLAIPTVALRYAVTFGPRQSVYNPYTGVASLFSTRILGGKPPVVYEDGRQTRDFVYVEDVAEANLFVAAHPEAAGRAFNVGSGQPVAVLGLVAALNEAYGTRVEPEVRSFRPGDVRHLYHDVTRLARLGFRARHDLRDGLRRLADWIRASGGLEDGFEEAERHLREAGIVMG